jgi:hypothetical protein
MRRTLRILSYIGLALATAILVILFSSGIPLPQSAQSNTAVALAKPFNDFPVDQPQFIDFRLDELSFGQLTEREKQDQLRDWLLFTVASDQDLSAQEISHSLYDLSTTRQGYMRPVSNFEYGTTRSLYVGEGEVVALIPTELTDAERTDALTHIADHHRKDQGKQPTSLLVFEYELHPAEQYALLTRREAIAAEQLFSATAGYTESTVSTLDGLQSFMDAIDDLTYARLDGSQIILGGRKIQGRTYGRIRVEDIAAIWQSEQKIRAGQYRVNGSGFSLDPAYDYESLSNLLASAESGLRKLSLNGAPAISEQDIQRAKQGLNPSPAPSGSNSSLFAPGSNNPIILPNLPTTPSPDIVPYLEIVEKIRAVSQQSPEQANLTQAEVNRINALLNSGQEQRFQAARYDGDLQGTEVGMVLFYTDLLAKLWALDYRSSTPQNQISDFAPLTTVSSKVSSIYKQEIEELSSTRLWFGPQDEGFQASSVDNSLLFARNATRIYAASSSPLQPGKETQAAADSEAFLGWWNDHYEEVAAYEPEYERLNEIMKWSLLVSWLNNAGQGDLLSFLGNVQVQRGFWFPDWARAQGDRLRFQDWETIEFYPKGYLGTTTEAMEIVESGEFTFFDKVGQLAGGVSLADEGLFSSRTALSSSNNLDPTVQRSTIDYSTLGTSADQLNFTTLEGTAYRLFNQQPTLSSVAAKAREGSKLRGRQSELANLEFVRDITRTDAGISVNTTVNGTDLGQLKTKHTGNGFDVGWQARDVDEGQLLAQQIQRSPDQPIETILNDYPLVAAVAQVTADNSYLVKLHGSDDWVQMSAGGGGSNIPPDQHARVGSFPDDPSRPIPMLLLWVDEAVVQTKLTQGTAKLIINKSNPVDVTVVLNPDELIQSLRERNYDQVAQQIQDDPESVQAIARNHITTELPIINALRQQNQPARALQRVDELISLYGNQPDLMLQRALLDIDRQRLAVQRIDPQGAGLTPVAQREDFFAVINRIFGRSDVETHFRVMVTADEVIYIQDSPGFNNVDPSTPIDDAFPFGSEARAYRVESGSIGNANVSGGGYDDPPTPVLLGSSSSGNSGGNLTSFNLNNYSISVGGEPGGDDSCEEEPEQTHCPRQVYVVVDGTTL